MPHDQPLTPQKQIAGAAQKSDVFDDEPRENTGDLDAMFADVNNLPADDPLRKAEDQGQTSAQQAPAAAVPANAKDGVMALLPKSVLNALHASGGSSGIPDASGAQAALALPKVPAAVAARSDGSVVVDSIQRVAVPRSMELAFAL